MAITRRLLLLLTLASPAAAGSGPAIPRHVYKPSETINYFFEDTDRIYAATMTSIGVRPGSLVQLQEIQVLLRVSVEPSGRKRLEYKDVRYRSAPPDKFNETPLAPISSFIPDFPKDFHYEFETGSAAVRSLQEYFKPWMQSSVGSFLYYKMLDVHTFQPTIDSLPRALSLGQISVSSTTDIPLEHGTFRNRQPATHFQRVEKIDGQQCALLKTVTVGNSYMMSDRTLDTDYQYTYAVALDGPHAGLLWKGELHETVIGNASGGPFFVDRQLSMKLRPPR